MKTPVRLNKDIMSLKESATLAVNLAAKKLRQEGKPVYHFGFGQSPFPVHPKIQMALSHNTHQKDYLPTRGLPELCSSISQYYKTLFDYDLNEDLIAVGPGSKELIFQMLYILEGPVIVPAPSWVSYGPQLQIRGKEILPIVTTRDNSYKLQALELRLCCQKIEDEQKILILNNPSNPTGAVYTDREIKELADVCREENVIIISDEIYAQVNFSGREYVGFHKYYPEGTMITAGLSKSHSAGGYRLGFISLPDGMEEVMKCLCAMISETFSAVSAPIQYAALETYSDDYDLIRYIERCTEIHGAASLYLHRRFIKMGLNCPKPEGAFYLFPDFQNFADKLKAKGLTDGLKLSKHLIDHYHVALLPGEDFYYPAYHFGCRIASVDYDGAYVYQQSLDNLFRKKEEVLLDDVFIEKHCPHLKLGSDQLEKFLSDLKLSK